ncbi:MAG: glycerophosphodiester phosphodiesterase [Gemmataceae bacterium]
MNGCRPITLVVLIIVTALLRAQDGPPTPRIVAHRGLLKHAPENTLPNFRACLELGLGFEFDVRRTRDGQLVCVHDDTVQRTTNGTGKVADLTLAELKKLDAGRWFDPAFAGERVPTIEEILALLKTSGRKDVVLAVDLKVADEGVPEEVVRLASKHGVLDRLLFIGLTISDARVRKRLHGTDPKAAAAVLAQTAKDLDAALEAPDADWIYVRFVPSKEEVARIRKAGKRLFISGPLVMQREPENWLKSRELGVDALLSDFPLAVRQTWRAEKKPPPR